MTDGEPPDETGESEAGRRSGEGDAANDAPDAAGDEGADGADAGGDETEMDPGAEVEAAVEETIGPGVLDDDEAGENDETDSGSEAGGAGAAGDRSGDPDDAAAGNGTTDPVTERDADGTDGATIGDAVATDGETLDDSEPSGDGETPDDGEPAADEAVDAGTADRPSEDGAERDGDGVDRGSADDVPPDGDESAEADPSAGQAVPDDVRKYDRFKKIDGGTYDRANEFLRERTYITAREWAMARLCADFRTETGVEMTKIGENLPELVPFMTDTYTPQAVNQARAAFEEKVRKAGATFLYGAMCDFFTAEELDDVMYESTEVAKFLLEVEGVELSVDEELAAEDHISEVMRDVREHSAALRHDEVTCPECGHEIGADD